MSSFSFEDLSPETHDVVRRLVLDGLAEHWGEVDEALNPDLDDMLESYGAGRTVVARAGDGSIVGTGTVVPRDDRSAEVVRMSVAVGVRRAGLGRRIVDELVATAKAWDCDRVVLETTSSWTDVVAFYEDYGFTVTHVADSDFGPETWFAFSLKD